MTIVFSGSGSDTDKLLEQKVYVAIVTDGFLTDERCLNEMRIAKKAKKYMIAIVKLGTSLNSEFYTVDWNHISYFNSKDDIIYAVRNALRGLIQ